VSNRLLDYNPETEGAEGDILLFGVPAHRGLVRASKELEELELASAFLDAANTGQLTAIARHLVGRGSAMARRPLAPQIARLLEPRLVRAGQAIRALLAPPATPSDTRDTTQAMERLTGAELEGLSTEDQEFETARIFVRFAVEAARIAASAPSHHSPAAIVAAAERAAARRFAPGLYPGFHARRAIRRQSQFETNF
jgi:hypothetical protein